MTTIMRGDAMLREQSKRSRKPAKAAFAGQNALTSVKSESELAKSTRTRRTIPTEEVEIGAPAEVAMPEVEAPFANIKTECTKIKDTMNTFIAGISSMSSKEIQAFLAGGETGLCGMIKELASLFSLVAVKVNHEVRDRVVEAENLQKAMSAANSTSPNTGSLTLSTTVRVGGVGSANSATAPQPVSPTLWANRAAPVKSLKISNAPMQVDVAHGVPAYVFPIEQASEVLTKKGMLCYLEKHKRFMFAIEEANGDSLVFTACLGEVGDHVKAYRTHPYDEMDGGKSVDQISLSEKQHFYVSPMQRDDSRMVMNIPGTIAFGDTKLHQRPIGGFDNAKNMIDKCSYNHLLTVSCFAAHFIAIQILVQRRRVRSGKPSWFY